ARLELVAANSHVDNVMRRHAAAYARWPIEKSWLNDAQRKKMLHEYELADAIHVTSEYTRQSMLAAGIPDSKLIFFPLTPHPRYVPRSGTREPRGFRVVYVGGVTVQKGIPL